MAKNIFTRQNADDRSPKGYTRLTSERLQAAHTKLEACYPHTMSKQDAEDFGIALKALDAIEKRRVAALIEEQQEQARGAV